jgi:hypothetical protein
MLIASLYCTWLLAWHELGFLPLPNRDDPKFMGWPVRFAHWVTWRLASMFSHAWIATVIFVPTAACSSILRATHDGCGRVVDFSSRILLDIDH